MSPTLDTNTLQPLTDTSQSSQATKWIVVLQKVGDNVRIQPDWTNKMKIGDTVQFQSPDGKVHVEFEPDTGQPSPVENPKIQDALEHPIINSSKGVMNCTIVTPAGLTLGYEQDEALAAQAKLRGSAAPVSTAQGSRYCTGTGCP